MMTMTMILLHIDHLACMLINVRKLYYIRDNFKIVFNKIDLFICIGTNCKSEIETCASAPCENNSTCISYAGFFHCLCPPGFIGDTCELGNCVHFIW